MKLRNKYYLLRHGQTIYQTKKKDLIYPPPELDHIPLTKIGKKQIEEVAKKLKKEKIDFIYSSDMLRTRQTAEIVAKNLGIKKINFSERLRDINMGVYHGRKKEEYYFHFPRFSKKRFLKAPKNGESWTKAQKRMLDFLKEIDKKHKGKKFLIISHGDPLWLLEGGVKKWSQDRLLSEKKLNYIKVGQLREF
jgi:broad specificity phosphatase PhoE